MCGVDHVVHPSVTDAGRSVPVLLAGGGVQGCGAGPGREPVPVGETRDVADIGEDPSGDDGPDAVDLGQVRTTFDDESLQLGGDLLHPGLDTDEVGKLFGGDSSPGPPSQVAGSDTGEHPLGLAGGDVLLDLSGKQSANAACSRATVCTRRLMRPRAVR